MARPYIHDEASAYYPPRARWYAFVFSLRDALRRRLGVETGEVKIGALIAGFFMPGMAVCVRGPRLWGQAALATSAVLILFFIVWLGYPLANFAFGLLLSLHCTGFVYYCSPLLAGEPFQRRLAFTFLTLLAMGLLLYLPARWYLQDHWLTPLRVHGQVIVVQRIFQARLIQRGDWVAYALDVDAMGDNYHGGTVWLRSRNGLSLGPVLAVAGDQVTFSTNSFLVNGICHPSLPHMPHSGELVVAEKHWFIWPNLGISGHGDVGEARVSEALMGLADVAETHFIGKPFQRWFWRKQKIP